MFRSDFDPYQIMIDLQQRVNLLYDNQEKLISAINHQGNALKGINESNQKNFELIMRQQQIIDELKLQLLIEQAKNTS